jgi:hypothetical protein
MTFRSEQVRVLRPALDTGGWAPVPGEIVAWQGGAGREYGRVVSWNSDLDVYDIRFVDVREGRLVNELPNARFAIAYADLDEVYECYDCALLDGHHRDSCMADYFDPVGE